HPEQDTELLPLDDDPVVLGDGDRDLTACEKGRLLAAQREQARLRQDLGRAFSDEGIDTRSEQAQAEDRTAQGDLAGHELMRYVDASIDPAPGDAQGGGDALV